MMKPKELWERIKEGVIPIMMTPFTSDDRLDEAGLRKQVQWLIEKDTTGELVGFLLTGTNAEFYALSDDENMEVIRIVVDEVAGRKPVIAGAMAVGTTHAVNLAKRIQDMGVDGIQIVNPYYIYPTQDDVIRHLEAVAGAIDLGNELYNNPITTHVYLNADSVSRLIDSIGEKIVCIKESSPTDFDFYKMVQKVGKKIHVVDNGGPFWAHQMWAATLGCRCFMFRPEWAPDAYEFSRAAKKMDIPAMLALAEKYHPLEEFVVRTAKDRGGWTYLQTTKDSMEYVGLPAGHIRAPLSPLSDAERTELRGILAGMWG